MYAFYSVDTGSHLTTENRQQRNTNLQLDAKDHSDSQSDTLCKWDKAPTGLGFGSVLQCVSPAVSLRSDIVSFSALRDKGHACDSSIIVRQRTKLFVLLLVFGLGLMTERS